ncbi:MAG: hypothetical protein ABIY52_10665 [Gemmatimonadaceae bacterium]
MTAYSIKDLGTIGGYHPVAIALSDADVVAGHTSKNRPFRWSNGALQELPTGIFTNHGDVSGISPSQPERIVGGLWFGASHRAALWTNGVHTDLQPLLGGGFTGAVDINEDGLVAAYSDDWAVRLNIVTKQVEKLVMLNDAVTSIDSMNKAGNVVGITGKAPTNAYLYDKGLHVIKTPGPVTWDRVRVNDHGVVAATYDVPGHFHHAFTYDFKAKVFRDIHGGPFVSSITNGINNSGVVVGTGGDSFNQYAWVWTEADGMQRLVDLIDASGWTLITATAINEHGRIVGNGVHNGQDRAFLLTPIRPKAGNRPWPIDLVALVRELIVAGGGMGVLLPDGSIIYPKDGPVDPDSPLQHFVAARSDATIGLAMHVLASRISDPATRAIAMKAADDITKRAAESSDA